MAYVPFTDEEQNKQNVTANPEVGGASGALPTTGGGGGAAPAAGGGNPMQAPTAPSASQGFANINQYLAANKDQAPQVAGTIASNLNNQYTGLQGTIDTAANQAGEAVKGGSTAYDPNLVNSAVSNPSGFAADPNNLAAWQKQYSAAYTGPTSFETSAGYGKAADAANKAGQTYQMGQTGGGYSQLLNQIEKNPTVGKTALDKSLIQADPNAQQTVQGALSPFKGIQDYVSGKSAEIGKQASDAAQQTQQTAQKTQEATQGAITGFGQDLSNKLKTATAARETGNADVQSLNSKVLSGQPLSAEDLSKLGVNGEQYKQTQDLYDQMKKTYGNQISPQVSTPYYTQGTANPNTPTAEGLATPEDFARESAFEKLTGNQLGILQNDQADKAGTYKDAGTPGKYDEAKQQADTVKKYQGADLNYLINQINPTWRQSVNTSDPKAVTDALEWAINSSAAPAWQKEPNYQQILDTISRMKNNTYLPKK